MRPLPPAEINCFTLRRYRQAVLNSITRIFRAKDLQAQRALSDVSGVARDYMHRVARAARKMAAVKHDPLAKVPESMRYKS